MDKDLESLDTLVNECMEKETALAKTAQELALKNQQFAQFIEQQKRQSDELAVLKAEIKDFMEEHDIKSHDTGYVELKLTPTGRYTCENIETMPDEVCKVMKTLDNAACKAYAKLHNGELPEGVTSCGNRLVMKVKGQRYEDSLVSIFSPTWEKEKQKQTWMREHYKEKWWSNHSNARPTGRKP